MTHPCVGTEQALHVFSPEQGTAENRRSTGLQSDLALPAPEHIPMPLCRSATTNLPA